MSLAPEDQARVDHALAYPFERPTGDFIFAGGVGVALKQWVSDDPADSVLEDGRTAREAFSPAELDALAAPRHAVIAIGSNSAPQRLREKYGDDAVVPTLAIRLSGFAVVHSAKFARYASVPATVHPEPGAVANLFVNLLTDDQLAKMDKTEDLGLAYDRVAMPRAYAEGLPDQAEDVMGYVSLHGPLLIDVAPAALEAARQTTRLPALSQRAVQAHAQALLGVDGPLEAFILENLGDDTLRQARAERLRDLAGGPVHRGV